jgi:hypothetical protein
MEEARPSPGGNQIAGQEQVLVQAPPAEEKPQVSPSKKKTIFLILVVFLILIGMAGGVYYFFFFKKKAQEEQAVSPPGLPPAPVITKGKFAEFPEVGVEIKPQVADYQIEKDFSNVINFNDFSKLSDKAKEKLLENAFVVTEGDENEFFPLYEENASLAHQYPSFITTDSVVHTYHLLFDYLLRGLEKEKLYSLLRQLNQKMMENSQSLVDELRGTEWENAALRNIGFFSVAGKLLDDNFSIPERVKNEVETELGLIEGHSGIALSPVVNFGIFNASGEIINPALVPSGEQLGGFKEDYSQYIPRGHYEKNEALRRYFKAMMWYGRITFRFKSDDEIKSAVLLVHALANDQDAFSAWESIYEVTNFFVGKSDDVGFYELNQEVEAVYGRSLSVKSLLAQSEFEKLKERLKELEPPAINSMPIYQADLQPDRETEIKSFRFMGQRFTIDASIFQRLVYREVGDKTKTCSEFDPQQTSCYQGARCLPSGLDIPAGLGSDEALSILTDQKETEYACYPENLAFMKTYVSDLSESVWTQNLYWGWLYSLLPLTEERSQGYPVFMKNPAWTRKQLNTFLGSWTELKHDTILYAKQVYAEMGGGGFKPEEKDDRGFVEPEPLIFARLAALTQMTREGLTSRDLISQENINALELMEELCLKLKAIAEKELKNELASDEEFEFIKSYGGNLEHLFMKAMADECQNMGARNCLDDNPAALVADVATDPNGVVLEEAIGRVFPVYVIIPIEGKLRIARGGVFSHYEFPWPLDDRLTDSKWRKMLDERKAPDLSAWKESFLAE